KRSSRIPAASCGTSTTTRRARDTSGAGGGSGTPENLARARHVGGDRLAQRLRPGEALLAAQPLDELEIEPAPVEVAGEVEEERLDRAAQAAEGGSYADVEDRGHRPSVEQRAHRVHPVGRQEEAGALMQVGGGKPEGSAALLAAHHAAAKLERPPDQDARAT